MSGHFLLAALNPVVSLCCAALMAYLARLLPNRGHLFLLCIAFIYLALGFVSQDLRGLSAPGSINYAGNLLFFSAIALATASTLVRVDIKVPVVLYAAIGLASLLAFIWFSMVSPALLGRILAVSAGFAAMCLLALVQLLRNGPRSAADRLMAIGLAAGLALSLARPLLALTGVLSLNPGGEFETSEYWASIRTLTPLVTVVITALFVTAITLDTVESLRRQANQDYLTGLLNRRGFELAVQTTLERTREGQRPALLVADVDDFKAINDTHGHSAGDEVLVAIGRLLAEEADTPIAGRTGGEEFAFFYADTSPDALQRQARRMLERLREARVAGLPEAQRVSVSIGLHLRDRDEDLNAMTRRADAALYDAKRAGKDRVILARTLRSA